MSNLSLRQTADWGPPHPRAKSTKCPLGNVVATGEARCTVPKSLEDRFGSSERVTRDPASSKRGTSECANVGWSGPTAIKVASVVRFVSFLFESIECSDTLKSAGTAERKMASASKSSCPTAMDGASI